MVEHEDEYEAERLLRCGGKSSKAPDGATALRPPEVACIEREAVPPLPGLWDPWPPEPLSGACQNCGHYVTTEVEDELECASTRWCWLLFSDSPLFTRTKTHICGNCDAAVGFHTGEACGRGLGCIKVPPPRTVPG
uniref:LITAF domain-containing protein n=1 Tax=Dunaliella tertiolecta TaxID=3047 RepID=A0A7S3QRN0_DUNTE|mmetsp:Transcript_22735/g.62803  ORF Transcript_22735/g.62803 Transcript_22735/m.62803 type:complete len:136 (-) Transcript_22735:508-915(-)|eukprot:CAMPEP_0202357998 /NCGR_PEP_ID=MMETSP1126-20121109/11808_1 /ASSEMBLY_ACC=CAM_ASM_000457 /TAXON_ID=3047 /ORGANISM="Dunaliella tertiolecta, Strain CCMP1320" /LENGTH=135 /DNA_ID=CAMNT_0048951005 /DNA_START=75 /DNA_END=482 /DNA_ORIENTATION=-